MVIKSNNLSESGGLLKSLLNVFIIFILSLLYLAVPFILYYGLVGLFGNDFFITLFSKDIIKYSGIALIIFYMAFFLVYITIVGEYVSKYKKIPNSPEISKIDLMTNILSLQNNLPIVINQVSNDKIKITWNYLNTQFVTLFNSGYINKGYEIVLKFDDKKKNVFFSEKMFGLTSNASGLIGPSFIANFTFFQGINLLRFETGTAYGFVIKDGKIQFDNLYQYKFQPEEIKAPITELIINNGWNFCPKVFLF